jgi:hypothetical protein
MAKKSFWSWELRNNVNGPQSTSYIDSWPLSVVITYLEWTTSITFFGYKYNYTVLQAGRLRIRITMESLGLFYLLDPSGRTMAVVSTQPLTEVSTKNISLGVKVAVA